MRSGVADAVIIVPVRQIIAKTRGVEGKFENLHAGQSAFIQQSVHLGREHAEILGNEPDVIKPRGEPADEIHARTGPPLPLLCAFSAARHCPIALKGAEMVDPQRVIQP